MSTTTAKIRQGVVSRGLVGAITTTTISNGPSRSNSKNSKTTTTTAYGPNGWLKCNSVIIIIIISIVTASTILIGWFTIDDHNSTNTDSTTAVVTDGDIVRITKNKSTEKIPNPSLSATQQQLLLPPCRYDGHCPIGSTCAVPPSTEKSSNNRPLLGVCETIDRPDTIRQKQQAEDSVITNNSSYNLCTQVCYNELQYDEHFFQDQSPQIQWIEPIIQSNGRPMGCKIIYKRTSINTTLQTELNTLDQSKSYGNVDHSPAIEKWLETRFTYSIRTDPYYYDTTTPSYNDNDHNNHNSKNKDDDLWMSYCFHPCTTNNDCITPNDKEWQMKYPKTVMEQGFVCFNHSCQRNPIYWNPPRKSGSISSNDDTLMNEEMVVVTAATDSYFYGLENLVASVEYWSPQTKVVVYNLGGMDDTMKQKIVSWKNVIAYEWENGVPSHYPSHINISHTYSWKPIIMNETLHKYKFIFWLDAGSSVTGSLQPAIDITRKTGTFLVKGQDANMIKSHEGMYEWFNTSKATFKSGPHYSGNTQAYLYPSRYVHSIVIPNALCSLDPKCIMPDGSSLGNHRYDQTSLSILAYHARIHAPHYTEYLAAEQSQLQADLTKPSVRFVLTSRQGVNFYTSLRYNKKSINNHAKQ